MSVCTICHVPLQPTAVEQLIAAADLAPLPTCCRLCRLLRRGAPLPCPPVVRRQHPRARPVPPWTLPTIVAALRAWLATHPGQVPTSGELQAHPTLPQLCSLLRYTHTSTLRDAYRALEAAGLPGLVERYDVQRTAKNRARMVLVRRGRQRQEVTL